jgi:hypothetical protein
MDYQVNTLTRFMTAAQSADAIARVPDLIATARDAGMIVIHVVVAFRPGHPEVSPRNPLFSALKANGMMVAGSEGAAIHPVAAAREGEPIVVKYRISPFVGTDFDTLVLAGAPFRRLEPSRRWLRRAPATPFRCGPPRYGCRPGEKAQPTSAIASKRKESLRKCREAQIVTEPKPVISQPLA